MLSRPRKPVIDIMKPSSIIAIAKLIFTVLIIQSRNKIVMHAHTFCVCEREHARITLLTVASVHFSFSILC